MTPRPAAAVTVLVGNRSPAGLPMAVEAEAGVPLRIPAADVAGRATDPDGDPVAILQVYETAATGGSVALDGGDVVFTADPDGESDTAGAGRPSARR